MRLTLSIALTLLLTISLGCQSENKIKVEREKETQSETKAEYPELRNITLAPIQADGITLKDALEQLNFKLQKKYPDHPHLPIIIEKPAYKRMDLSDQKIGYHLKKIPLQEYLRVIATQSSAHWRVSENGFIIFKMWHLGDSSWDDEDPDDTPK